MIIVPENKWNINKESKELFRRQTLLPIPESAEEWEMIMEEADEEGCDLQKVHASELSEVREELGSVLPERFIPYLENGLLNQPELPDEVRNDYLKWIHESTTHFEEKLDAAYENKKEAAAFLSTEAADVFTDSLHDGILQRIERKADLLKLSIDLESGFSQKALIILTFKEIFSEVSDEPLQEGHWMVYDELLKTKDGFALRVLFDTPENQWTIHMKDIEARCFFRPQAYVKLKDEEKLETLSVSDYLTLLNPDHQYRFISSSIDESISLADSLRLDAHHTEHPAHCIYTDVYEDPYEHFHEEMPAEQIESAALSNEIELQVQAWNTLYQKPQEFKTMINHLLSQIELTEENEMWISVYAQHFYNEGVLNEEIVKQLQPFIEVKDV
ncbi:hypothetical protein JMA_02750 [Jeotgalibacillus malaysiensis]|uniref:Group-specific protein n=1 Tax=Jeotgalibacillus malaysiensis TaxID=1508404 RepID=A0A0B5ALK8_9BACL|nr:DUF4085 family protein [Jeotgalibacillus malaysiensis]AJD89592.1 hypothetical protein JMA_02750 [Jeotgalibacillus malaysiensis]